MKKISLLCSVLLMLNSCFKKKEGDYFIDEISSEEAAITLDHASFTKEETTALNSAHTDGLYTEGTIEYRDGNTVLASVNFGDGTNDEVASIDENGSQKNITLVKENDYYKGKKSAYKKVIIEPIVKSLDCGYIVSGIIKYYEIKSGDWTATVDFGDGTCDDIADKTTAEGVYTFKVSEYYK